MKVPAPRVAGAATGEGRGFDPMSSPVPAAPSLPAPNSKPRRNHFYAGNVAESLKIHLPFAARAGEDVQRGAQGQADIGLVVRGFQGGFGGFAGVSAVVA